MPSALLLLVMLAALVCAGQPLAQPVAANRERTPGGGAAQDPGAGLRDAQDLLKARRYRDALAKLQELDRSVRSAFDTFEIEQVRAAAAVGAGDIPAAIKAHEALLASALLAPADRLPTLRALVGLNREAKDHAQVIAWATHHAREGGADPQVGAWLARSYFDTGDPANAARELQRGLLAAERAAQVPPEEQLILLQRCYVQLGDANATLWVLEKLLIHHPRRGYWAELLERLEQRLGAGHRLTLEVLRLRWMTGTMRRPDDHLQLAAQALQAGLPAEAAKVMEQGLARSVLGQGRRAAEHQELRERALIEQRRSRQALARPETVARAASARDGIWLHALGLAGVMDGAFVKGLALMEQGMRKGGMGEKPQDAKLRLGIAYLLAGQKDKALETLKDVTGSSGAADVGRVWAIYALTADSMLK